jgi:dTDP-4-dehydrorhamnose reductase
MNILILGASGMVGNAMFRVLSEESDWQVLGTLRSNHARRFFLPDQAAKLLGGVDVESTDALVRVFARVRPDVVINCVALIKQLDAAVDPLRAIPLNAMLPHRLADLCAVAGARLVHLSTDCVFSGGKGNYLETDVPDALDLYGRSKYLGEVDYPHAITLRTSVIGHELQSCHGLLEWFLAQESGCKGYCRAVFSGLPSVELARVVMDFVIPRPELRGLYHVSSEAINKYDLLCEIAKVYGKNIDIQREEDFVIDRSLNSGRFRQATGYVPASWPKLIRSMHASH